MKKRKHSLHVNTVDNVNIDVGIIVGVNLKWKDVTIPWSVLEFPVLILHDRLFCRRLPSLNIALQKL